MKKILLYTFGGLAAQYYFRQLFFASFLLAITIFGILKTATVEPKSDIPLIVLIIGIATINTLLYPYSRFVYESVVRFIFGDNTYYAGGILLIIVLFIKLFTIMMCWVYAMIIAPIGLVYLYFRHSRTAR